MTEIGLFQFLFLLELPIGWEECIDSVIGTYFINHNTGTVFIHNKEIKNNLIFQDYF